MTYSFYQAIIYVHWGGFIEKLNIDIDEAIAETMKIIKNNQSNQEDTFSKYSPIYMAPTGNVTDAVNLYKNNIPNIDNALVVGTQGSFAYELALNGVKKIDCFDKNILQYLYFTLYNIALMTCDYKDFIDNFTSKKLANGMQKFK